MDEAAVDIFETTSGRHYVAFDGVKLQSGAPVYISVTHEMISFTQNGRRLAAIETIPDTVQTLIDAKRLIATEMQGQSLITTKALLDDVDFLPIAKS